MRRATRLNDVVAFVYSVGRDFQPFGIIDHLNRVARLIIAVLHLAAVRLRHEQRFFVRVIAVVDYSYDADKKTLLMTQPNGRQVQYGYNEAGNPIQMIDDAEGLKITTNTVYEGNNVIQSGCPPHYSRTALGGRSAAS